MLARADLERDALDDLEAVAGEADELARVVREEAHLADAEVVQDLRADPVVAEVGREAEFEVRVDRVAAVLLKRIGTDLVREADPATLLAQVHERPAARRGDPLHRHLELLPAVAAPRVEDVAREALAVDPDERRLPARALARPEFAHRERDVRLARHGRLVEVQVEVAAGGRELHGRGALDELLRPAAVPDDVGDRGDLDAMLLGELDEVRQPRHAAVVAYDLADDARRRETRHAREVDPALGLPGADEHSAFPRAERHYMSGPHEVCRLRVRLDGCEDGVRALRGRDAGRRPEPRVDLLEEGRAEARRVLRRLRPERKRVRLLAREREADEPPPVADHEVHRIGRDALGRDVEVALVLAVFVIDEDDHPALPDLVEYLRNRREGHASLPCVGHKETTA